MRRADCFRGRGLIDQGAFTAMDVEFTVDAVCDPVSRVWEWTGTFDTDADFPLPDRGAATLRVEGAGSPIVITHTGRPRPGSGAFLGCGAPPAPLIGA